MPKPAPIVLILGKPLVGKSEVRKRLSVLTGLPGASCSDVIKAVYAAANEISFDEVSAKPKEEIRPTLVALGDWLCGARESLEGSGLSDEAIRKIEGAGLYRGPSALFRSLFHSRIAIIDGVRRVKELEEVLFFSQWLGVPAGVVWVENSRAPEVLDNTEITSGTASEIASRYVPASQRVSLTNEGSIDDLDDSVRALALHLKLIEPDPAPEPVPPPTADDNPPTTPTTP